MGLTSVNSGLKFGESALSGMSPQPSPIPPSSDTKRTLSNACKHPRVQIVARDEDSEFVECKECGEVFEASEFKDMAIEERIPDDEA
jgi:hypothetical protein